MNKSASIQNIASALVKFQSDLPKVKFDSTNPFMKYKYASLMAVVSAGMPRLNAFGLAISQFPAGVNGEVGITSILMHETGEWIEETVMLPTDASKGLSIGQSAGVSITYLRRYGFASITGLVADEDTDGDDGSNAEAAVKNLMGKRKWSAEQTEAISVAVLDAELEPLRADEAVEILNMSALPQDAPVKTVASWFSRYLKSDGKTPLDKAADANNAYIEAKKKAGGK